MNYPRAEQVKLDLAIHFVLDELQTDYISFDLTISLAWKGRFHCSVITFTA